jgi:hypothetical protein
MRMILRPGSIHDRARPGAHLIPFETKLLGREDLAGPGRHCRSTPAICQALPNRQGPCPALHAAIMARPRFDRAQEGLSSLLSMSLNRTSIGCGQTWIWSALIPSLSNFESSRSMIRVPFKSIVT